MSKHDIQLFVPFYRTEECLKEIAECLDSGWTGLGYKTIEFEAAWCKYSGLPYAHFLSSATAGLHLALRLFKENDGWQDDDEIITTPLTFVSTNHAILYEGLKPIFADVDEYLCLDPRSVADKITKRTKAVMFVGLGGNTGNLQEIADICQRQGLRLILDAAHMAGTTLNGQHIGSQADVTVFSYHAVKNLPMADGGMICFREEVLDREARKWTWLGINKDTYARTVGENKYRWRYDVVHEGFKYHGNSIMAALGLVALKYLDQDNDYRRQISTWYDEMLDANIQRVPVPSGCVSSRHLYQVLVDDRDEIILKLNDLDIYPGVHYRDNTEYQMYHYANNTCPRAQEACQRLLSLPLHLKLFKGDVERVASGLNTSIEYLQTGKSITSHV